jgi:hypothetical protein
MYVKVRNPMFKRAHLYASGVQREFDYFEGELVATPKWVEYPAIALTTNESKFKFRIIPKEDIVEINGKVNTEQLQSKTREVIIKGSKGDTYTVSIDKDSYSCNCSGFMFRRSCRHIMEARNAS